MLITGRPGIGKTDTVVKHARALTRPWQLESGGMSSAKDLYQYLFRHRENMILIFDDMDDVLLSKPAQRLLKSVLDMSFEKEHIVSYFDKAFVPPEVYETMTPKQKQRNTPNRFEFSSRAVFVSNSPRKKFDPAILSRSLNVDFDVSNEEILARVRDKIDDYNKTVDRDIKLEALEFLEENFDLFKVIDYRTFYKVLVIRLTENPAWKKWAFNEIAAAGA
jgi:hypothetical protein